MSLSEKFIPVVLLIITYITVPQYFYIFLESRHQIGFELHTVCLKLPAVLIQQVLLFFPFTFRESNLVTPGTIKCCRIKRIKRFIKSKGHMPTIDPCVWYDLP